MGQLEQFAKQMFDEETAVVTHGAIAWQAPPEIGLAEVRIDGLLCVREPALLVALAAPWPLVQDSDEIVVELKMPGDHLDLLMVERALLRRQARQVQRMEPTTATPWEGQAPRWIVAPHLPSYLADRRDIRPAALGCYHVDRSPFSFLWVAANELPLVEELIPFLMVRSGRALDEFARWCAARRPSSWVLRMIRFLPMSTSVSDELLLKAFGKNDDPEISARERRITRALVNAYPDVGQELIDKGIEKGIEKGRAQELFRMYERRLARPMTEEERGTLHKRLGRLGSERLGNVVLDLSAEALAAWLADPGAR